MIMSGHVRRPVMFTVDPTTVNPNYSQPPRATVCPNCDHGNTWVRLEGQMDALGRLQFTCPNCGRAA